MTRFSAKVIDTNEITPQSNYVWVDHDGSCLWQPRFELSVTHCDIDVMWFPFDVQKCQLMFESWILSADELNISTPLNDSHVLSDYLPTNQWTLTCECHRD